jgi:hypothetical protein
VGGTVFSYVPGGRLQTEDGPWANDTVTSSYQYGLRTSLALQQPGGGWTSTCGYDAARRLTNVTSGAGAFGYQYVASRQGLVSRLALPGGSYVTNHYDSVARLLFTKLMSPAAAVIASEAYSYNPGNQRTQQVFTAGNYVNYSYDPIGQLQTAKGQQPGCTSRALEQLRYTYDPAGNLNWRTNNDLAAVPSELLERTHQHLPPRQRDDRGRHHQRRHKRNREHPHGTPLCRLHVCPHQRQPE